MLLKIPRSLSPDVLYLRLLNDAKGAVWTAIVSEKISKQAEFLREICRDEESELISSYIDQIEFADSTNREGHAAKVYFNALFGKSFSRGADNAVNAALNYGYSIVLSAFNREIVANGYTTELGLFHSNMFNRFNRGCDLIEPLFVKYVDKKLVLC